MIGRSPKNMEKRSDYNIIEPLQNTYCYLPDHVILDHILPRLPVKSLVRFKSVCKNWCSFISSSQFQKSHLQISSSRHHFLLFCSMYSRFFLLHCDEHHGWINVVKLNDESLSSGVAALVGCCNGLVCLDFYDKMKKKHFFLLWNPATHEYRKINSPDQRYPFMFGFGYASLVEDYKIFSTYKNNDRDLDLYVFSLRAGSWKRIGNLRDHSIVLEDSFEFAKDGLLFDDTLYWYIYVAEERYARILGFHLVNEQFEETARMNVVCDEYKWMDVHVINGSLALHGAGAEFDDDSDVWIRKQHGNSNSWHKVFSVPPHIHLLGFSPKGECLMQERGGSLIMFVDQSRVASVTNFSNPCYKSVHYVESLISPWNNKADEENIS